MPSQVWRTTLESCRCGAVATSFDYEQARTMPLTDGHEYTEDEMWESLEYWIRIVSPSREEVRMRGFKLEKHE
jgi:hypothetical protein